MDTRSLGQLQMPDTYGALLAREHPRASARAVPPAHGGGGDEGRMTVAEFFELVAGIDAARAERGWHLDMARRTADHFHGPLTFALMSAPTIGAGLDAFARYIAIRAPYFRCAGTVAGTRYRIALEAVAELGTLHPLLCEMPLLILHDYVAMIGAVNPGACTVLLDYARSAGRLYYERFFACEVRFAQPATALELPAAWRAIPNPQHESSTWAHAIAQCEVALAALDPADVVTRTRAYLALRLRRAPQIISIDDAARSLGLSVRTLIRRLRDSGTSFHALRDAARQELAQRLLQRPGTTVEQIAAALGYSDAANFHRAFKRWTGMSPGRYRRGGAA